MRKHLLRLTAALALLLGGGLAVPGTAVASTPAPAAGTTADGCPTLRATHDILSGSGTRWGYVNEVNSSGCNHWASAAMHDKMPPGYQVNVTLTRYNYGVEFDHRYCKIQYGDGTTCATLPAVHTESCQWTYSASAIVYRKDGATWTPIASGYTATYGSCIR